MNNPIVSIIIPAYNVEPYIQKCVDSVLCQTLVNKEIIIVNDGSTDNTLNILLKYKEKNNQINLISQENGGLSNARNTGLKNAKGEYIVFLDSDDWLTTVDSLTIMVNTIKRTKTDYVQCGFEFVKGEKHCVYKVKNKKNINGINILKDTILVRGIFTSVWNKIYSHEFIKNNKLMFIDGLVNEDSAFSIMASSCAKSVGFLDKVVYSSRERDGSLSRTSYQRMFKSMHEVLNITRQFLINEGKYTEEIKKIYEGRYLRSMLYNLLQSAQRNNIIIFKEDYNYCMRNTDYKDKLLYSKYLPIPHRLCILLSNNYRIFYSIINIIKLFGYRMH